MKQKFFNLANIASLSRILLAAVFVILVAYGRFKTAAIIFIIAMLTDLIDGVLARSSKQDSSTGAFLDPFCDKVLIISAILALFIKLALPLWILFIFARDVFVFISFLVYLFSGTKKKFDFKASLMNKFVTVFQMLTIISILLLPRFQNLFFLITVLVSVPAIITYIVRIKEFINQK